MFELIGFDSKAKTSETMEILNERHGTEGMCANAFIKKNVRELKESGLISGVSDHSVIYSKNIEDGIEEDLFDENDFKEIEDA